MNKKRHLLNEISRINIILDLFCRKAEIRNIITIVMIVTAASCRLQIRNIYNNYYLTCQLKCVLYDIGECTQEFCQS